MPVAILSALLWDLRAQCEAQLRALTDAQKQLDAYRDGGTQEIQDTALTALANDVKRVLATNRNIRESAEDATAAVSRLAAERGAQGSSS
jgi:hypothetical protein